MQSYLLNPIIPAECKFLPVYQFILQIRAKNIQVSDNQTDKGKTKQTTRIKETSSWYVLPKINKYINK
jgi:hypothetical protein